MCPEQKELALLFQRSQVPSQSQGIPAYSLSPLLESDKDARLAAYGTTIEKLHADNALSGTRATTD